MSALRTIGLRVLIVFVISFDVSADDILSQLFKTEIELAEQGNAAAMYIVGTMYEEGSGVDQNDEQAVAWYRKAAARGNREAEAKLFNVNIKRGTTPAKGDSNSKTMYERARANELEIKLTRERQAAEKARQEAEQLKADTAQVRLLEEQRAHDRAEADKAKEASEKARRIAEKTNLLEEQRKLEKAEADKARAEAEKARLEAENARLLGERFGSDRGPVPNSQNASDAAATPADNTADTTEFKANPCDTPAARFMSTCR